MSKTKNAKFKWRKLLFAATAAATSLVAPAAEVLAWDTNIPDESYTMGTPSKYGILNHISNNCEEDNYQDGDNNKACLGVGLGSELEFVRIRKADDTNANFEAYAGAGEYLALEPGVTYEVRAYYHNEAMAILGNMNAKAGAYYVNNHAFPEGGYTDLGECGGIGTIYNTRFRIKLPQSVAAGQTDAQLGAQYTYDSFHWDDSTKAYQVDGDGNVALTKDDYVFDSLHLANLGNEDIKIVLDDATVTLHNANATNGTKLATNNTSDNDVFPESTTGGALIGSLAMDGKVCACSNYSGYVSYTFHTEQASSDLVKEVSLDGENFSSSIEANPGDTVTYRVRYTNTGSKDLTNVTFRDELPEGVTLVPGTTKLVDNANPDGKILADVINTDGFNLGLFGPGASATLTYQVKLDENLYDQFECENTLENKISVVDDSSTGPKTSTSRIVVREDCDNPGTPTTPPEYPHTGPAEIITAIIAVAALAVGGTYWYRSQKDLKRATAGAKAQNVSAKKDEAPKAQNVSAKKDEAPKAQSEDNAEKDIKKDS